MNKIKELAKNKPLLYGAVAAIAVLVVAGGYWLYLFASTPAHLRNPQFEHYHFRTQIVVNGKPVDFSGPKFQVKNDTGGCSAELSGHPVDFHDGVDQMTHVHWDGLTGGEFLKYFGWDFIGGGDDVMGRRFDQGMMGMHRVHTFGNVLPAIPQNAGFYVYIGDEDGYVKKDWDDFLQLDLEAFFGKQSNLNQDAQAAHFRPDSWLFRSASAHGAADDGHSEASGEQDLERVNNLIGNVVIFVQPDEPAEQQVKERFSNLVPLTDSACGG